MNYLNTQTGIGSSTTTVQTAALKNIERMRIMQSWPSLKIMHSVNAQDATRLIEMTAAIGICPWGFKVGDHIAVEVDGTLSCPICRPAITTLNPELNTESDLQVSWLCPLAIRYLTFSIGR